jgi:hypothetical protein
MDPIDQYMPHACKSPKRGSESISREVPYAQCKSSLAQKIRVRNPNDLFSRRIGGGENVGQGELGWGCFELPLALLDETDERTIKEI